MRLHLIVCFLFVTLLCVNQSKQIPRMSCSFELSYQYPLENVRYGEITINNISYGITILEVELSQIGTTHLMKAGTLRLKDKNTFYDYVEQKKPIKYEIHFPLHYVSPKVVSIKVNDFEICSGYPYNAPSTKIILKHTLKAFKPKRNRRDSVPHTKQEDDIKYVYYDFDSAYINSKRSLSTAYRKNNFSPILPKPKIVNYRNMTTEQKFLTNTINNSLKNPKRIVNSYDGPNEVPLNQFNINKIANFENWIAEQDFIKKRINKSLNNPKRRVNSTLGYPFFEAYDGPNEVPSVPTTSNQFNINKIANFENWTAEQDFVKKSINKSLNNPKRSVNSTVGYPSLGEYDVLNKMPSIPTTSNSFKNNSQSKAIHSQYSSIRLKLPNISYNVSLAYLNSVCGQENSMLATRLQVLGEPIIRSRFPWIVAVFQKTDGQTKFQCGASLISTRTIVSAAHCFFAGLKPVNPENVMISMGLHNLTEWMGSSKFDVENIIIHPDFQPTLITFDGDVAMVVLKKNVIFTTSIRPICLWEGNTEVRAIEGISGAIVGWGSDGHRNTTTIPTLVDAKIVSRKTCIRSELRFIDLTSERTLCAGNLDGSGPCMGDSGSGLMIKNGNRWYLRGTVSAGFGTATVQCKLEEYAIYCDVAKFMDWIQSNMIL